MNEKKCIICGHEPDIDEGCENSCNAFYGFGEPCCDGECVYSIDDLSYRDFQLIAFAINKFYDTSGSGYLEEADAEQIKNKNFQINYNYKTHLFDVEILDNN